MIGEYQKECCTCQYHIWSDENVMHVCTKQEGNPEQPMHDLCKAWVQTKRGYAYVSTNTNTEG